MKKMIVIENIKTPKVLGVAVKRLRKQKSLSQAALAKIMNIRQPTISDIENGKGTLESFFKIVQALDINLIVAQNGYSKGGRGNSKINEMLKLISQKT